VALHSPSGSFGSQAQAPKEEAPAKLTTVRTHSTLTNVNSCLNVLDHKLYHLTVVCLRQERSVDYLFMALSRLFDTEKRANGSQIRVLYEKLRSVHADLV
jgi:hypothetical protein